MRATLMLPRLGMFASPARAPACRRRCARLRAGWWLLGWLLLIAPRAALAQPGSLDGTFVPPSGLAEQVTALAVQTDGRVVVGSLSQDSFFPGWVITRLNAADGSFDASFTATQLTNEPVLALALDGSGRIVVGGGFTQVQGQSRKRVARLQPDGVLDPTFDPVAGVDGDVQALAVQPDGRILISGKFASVNGTNRNGVARLNQDGSLDASFNPGLGLGNVASNEVRSIALGQGGTVLVAGNFTSFNATNRSRIARLNSDGSLDLRFDPGAGPNELVTTMVVQSDGSVLVGGQFTAVGGITRRRLARLNADGSLDTSFAAVAGLSSGQGPFPFPGPPVETRALALQADGRVLVGGNFYYVNGVRRDGLARLNSDGTLDYDFDTYDGSFFASSFGNVSALALQPDGNVLVGGSLIFLHGAGRNTLARVHGSGTNFAGRFEFSAAVVRTNEGAGAVQLTVKRSGGSVGAATVHYATSPGSAYASADYDSQSDTLSFAPGETEKTVSISIVNDTEAEDVGCCFYPFDVGLEEAILEEVFSVNLDSPTGGAVFGGQKSALVVIQDDDTAFAFDAASYSASEWDGRVTLRVLRLGNTDGTNAVTWITTDGTATAGVDYVATSNTVVFLPGETSKDIWLTILEDELTESNETVNVTLIGPTLGATVASPATAVLTIEDHPGAVVSTLPGALDTNFFATWPNVGIQALAVGSDDKIFAARSAFPLGSSIPQLARLFPDGSLEESFRAPQSLSGPTVALQADDRAWVAIGNYDEGRVARLNADGGEDTTFGPVSYTGGWANGLARQPDGRLVLAGNFTNVNGVARQWIARLNENGSLDSSFDPGIGPGRGVYWLPRLNAVALQADGKVLASGDFTTWSEVPRAGLARLNSNGSLDTNFNPPTVAGFINVIVVQRDGKVLMTGNNLTVNGAYVPPILRLTSTGGVDATFTPDAAIENVAVTAMASQDDGKIVLGLSPSFTYPDRVVRLNPDGSLDVTFDTGTGPDAWVRVIALQHDGGIVVGGEFMNFNGRPRRGLVRLIGGDPPRAAPLIKRQPISATVLEGADVSFSVAFSGFPVPTFQWTFNGQPLPGATAATLTLQNVNLSRSGTYAVVMSNILGVATSSNATLSVLPAPTQPGAVDLSFRGSSNFNRWQGYDLRVVTTLAVQSDGKVVVFAGFTRPPGFDVNGLARLNADGSLDDTFDRGKGISGSLQTLALQPDGKVLIAGWFSEVNGERRANIARLNADGRLDASFDPQESANYEIRDLAVQPDGKIVIGGEFTSFNGVTRQGVVRLNRDGSLDPSFDPGSGARPGIAGGVWTVALQNDGKVLIGGGFDYVNDQPRAKIARLNSDGSLDATFNPAASADSAVFDLAVQTDGKILLSGWFLNVNGARLIRLHSDGTLDNTFDPGMGVGADFSGQRLMVQNFGRVLISGGFTTFDGAPRARIARLQPNGRLDAGFDPGAGASDTVYALALQADGRVLIGGSFTNVDGRPRVGIARLLTDPLSAAGQLEFSVAGQVVPETVATNLLLEVRRTGGARGVVQVNCAVSGGSASPSADFALATGTLVFGDGDATAKTVPLHVLDDQLAEGNETLEVWLGNPIGGAVWGPTAATSVTIIDDDPTPGHAVTNLLGQLDASVLPTKDRQPLLVTLQAALASFNRGNIESGVNQLRAFQNKVQAQIAPVAPQLAAELIQSAQAIIDRLQGHQAEPRFTAIARPAPGERNVKFNGAAGRSYFVQATTNLTDWLTLGRAKELGNGAFEFEDAAADKAATRFYRVVSP